MSQNTQILEYLKGGKSINPMEALSRFGCFRLGARIHDLKGDGHNIVSEIKERNGKRFAEYRLAK